MLSENMREFKFTKPFFRKNFKKILEELKETNFNDPKLSISYPWEYIHKNKINYAQMVNNELTVENNINKVINDILKNKFIIINKYLSSLINKIKFIFELIIK